MILAGRDVGDACRKWYALADQRVCILCENLVNGRMIDVGQDHDGTHMLHCPTSGCSGTPRDWFYCGFKWAHRSKVPQEPRNDPQLQLLRQIDSQRARMNVEDAEIASTLNRIARIESLSDRRLAVSEGSPAGVGLSRIGERSCTVGTGAAT